MYKVCVDVCVGWKKWARFIGNEREGKYFDGFGIYVANWRRKNTPWGVIGGAKPPLWFIRTNGATPFALKRANLYVTLRCVRPTSWKIHISLHGLVTMDRVINIINCTVLYLKICGVMAVVVIYMRWVIIMYCWFLKWGECKNRVLGQVENWVGSSFEWSLYESTVNKIYD